MRTLESALNDETNALIKEYNTNSRFNSLLAKDKECNELFEEILSTSEFRFKSGYDSDRFVFISRLHRIEKGLIDYVHDNFHGIKCIIKTKNGTEISGIIEHNKTRQYNDHSSNELRTVENGVTFRRRFEDDTYSEPDTIALWVVTHDRMSTHLYPCSQIFID